MAWELEWFGATWKVSMATLHCFHVGISWSPSVQVNKRTSHDTVEEEHAIQTDLFVYTRFHSRNIYITSNSQVISFLTYTYIFSLKLWTHRAAAAASAAASRSIGKHCDAPKLTPPISQASGGALSCIIDPMGSNLAADAAARSVHTLKVKTVEILTDLN